MQFASLDWGLRPMVHSFKYATSYDRGRCFYSNRCCAGFGIVDTFVRIFLDHLEDADERALVYLVWPKPKMHRSPLAFLWAMLSKIQLRSQVIRDVILKSFFKIICISCVIALIATSQDINPIFFSDIKTELNHSILFGLLFNGIFEFYNSKINFYASFSFRCVEVIRNY